MPIAFIACFRASLSAAFSYDLAGARPGNRLTRDIGLYDATRSCADWDLDEEIERHYDVLIPVNDDPREQIETVDDLARYSWNHIRAQHPDADGTPIKPRPWWRRWRTGGRNPHEPGRNAH